MRYTFKSGIDAKLYDEFVRNYPSTSFMQTPSWANVKSAWESDLVGMFEEDKLVCSAMILKRKLFLGKKLFYIPRGFVIDYKNEELLTEFTNSLVKYAKKNNAIDIKIDPFICFSEESVQSIKKKKDVRIRRCFTDDVDKIDANLKAVGFIHGGFKKEVNAYIQSRFTMAISLKDIEGNPYDREALRRTFPKNTRNYIGSYHEERGVSFSFSKDIKDVEELVKVLNCTEQRQHITLRSKRYFETLMKNFPDEAVLFFAKVNVDKYVEFLRNDMALHEDKKEFCEKQMKEALELKKEYGNLITAGATIVMMPTCKKGTKVASFLYAGTNTKVLPSLKMTNGLMFYRLCYCLDNGADYCDLGGVDGSLEDHLSTFKSKFNPVVLELVGEYDLVISKFYNSLFKMGMNIIKYVRSKR